ncbi:ATP-binding protein [Pseudidiomarina terrestris]|uniref:ATP-binding protein n=1 Tax=Pseudidiomarina terrestris TaxID=2820060 RepID=UPI0026543DDF|nr:ATP-binding protein [Pseudidiomarina sp. 1ASP75-5]MDN7135984.1 ATP-binding protein [Pseudidiomarina sp. 1ASP75-5]
MKSYDIVNPSAAAMIESLRAYGYSLNTAIADIIDNSISAGANNIWIHLHWGGDGSWLSLADDGIGMDNKTLINAMRPGSSNPLDVRPESDLGRFGLGLKTASFSQCRSLTVASKVTGGEPNLSRWDLDYVGKHNEWRLLKDARPGSVERFTRLKSMEHGTIVLLENLDRLCHQQNVKDESQRRKFFARIESLTQHISMVFHRFMERRNGLNIFINGYDNTHKLRPWDPFLSLKEATLPQPQEKKAFHAGIVKVKGYVLPHKDKLSTDEYEAAAGQNGWNDQQGFYIYRNERLLVAGSWLGLGGHRHGWTKEEHYKLARIKVDIPNSMDSAWQIDVKKSTAVPPALVADWLENYAVHVRKEAREVFSHRGQYGQRTRSSEITRLWKTGTRSGSQIYKIDRQNDLVKNILQHAGALKLNIEVLLRMLEETVPVQQIWLDIAEYSERSNEPMGGLAEKQVLDLAETTLSTLVGSSRKATDSDIEYICKMEGFTAYADIIRAKYQGVKK